MKKTLIILSFIFILIIIPTIGYSIVSANSIVTEEEDILLAQTNKETYITPYGYTIDNPNIILNPYGISPLTALILFETEQEEKVSITIHGKDQNSTYTNTFESTTRHYIPVYGLYANESNNITLKCGDITKNITIETSSLPKELQMIENITNDTNKLTFITSSSYPYALDNNNEVRWYLTKKYSGQIDYLENNHLLLGGELTDYINQNYNLVEIDLLGKIHKKYTLDSHYLGTYEEKETSLILHTTNPIEIDKQTGTILNSKEELSQKTRSVIQNKNLLPLYTNKKHYELTISQNHNLTKETKESTKNIVLIGYKKINDNYNNYNINIIKTNDNLQITGDFTENDEVYLILDKFLDKRIYDISNIHTIINNQGLLGKYSIYIKINDTIYKTNNYVKF